MSRALSLKLGVSGVRGIAGESLTPRIVTSFAAAFGTYCGRGRILIGSDPRPSREMVVEATFAGLLSVGATPVDLGILPTPILQRRVRTTDAVGGICVSASHNPEDWNALKLFGADGIILRERQFLEILDLYHQEDYPRVGADEIADIEGDEGAAEEHQEAVLATTDPEAIRARRFRVAVDCVNGAGSRFAPDFLRRLGCDVVELDTDPERSFPRDPEPLAVNLGKLGAMVRASHCDLGFALDADADRLAILDERGVALGEDATLALAVELVLSKRSGPVVVNLSTSRAIEEIAARHGATVHRTPVGELHVVECMLRVNARVGGEGNGGVILPEANLCRDSFVGMALVLESLARGGGTISALAAGIPRHEIVKARLPCRGRDVARILRVLRRVFREESLELSDGVKVEWPDAWVHVRGSNTEPVLRIVAEARERSEAESLIERVLEEIRPRL